jgi:osmotically-inducible protein OsmY
MGVKGINNVISIKQVLEPNKISEEIKNAYVRLADIEATNISIKVIGGMVILSGKVNTISQKEEAENVAFNTLGVTNVINKIEVAGNPKYNPDYEFSD